MSGIKDLARRVRALGRLMALRSWKGGAIVRQAGRALRDLAELNEQCLGVCAVQLREIARLRLALRAAEAERDEALAIAAAAGCEIDRQTAAIASAACPREERGSR